MKRINLQLTVEELKVLLTAAKNEKRYLEKGLMRGQNNYKTIESLGQIIKTIEKVIEED